MMSYCCGRGGEAPFPTNLCLAVYTLYFTFGSYIIVDFYEVVNRALGYTTLNNNLLFLSSQ